MFGKLKDKLKGWTKKVKEEELVEELDESVEKVEPINEKKAKKSPKILKEQSHAPEEEPIKEEKKSFLKKLFSKSEEETQEEVPSQEESPQIKETEEQLVVKTPKKSLFKKVLSEEKFDELFEELELILLQNNVATKAVDSIKDSLKNKLVGKSLKEVNLEEELKNSIEDLLINPPNFLEEIKSSIKEKSPFVIVFAGINGAGKTTTIAKITNYLQKNNLKVCLAAADTFRAASIEQLQEHADKLKVHLIKKDYGTDPAAVGFDAIAYAKKNSIDVVLIDTAGRLQNKDSLMREIEKIVRVNNPDMKIFLGESITGNDATDQAASFNESMGLTGLILSKADVDEKGGTAISISHVTGKPIFFLGTGQSYDDLEVFDKNKLIDKLGL